MEPPRRRAPRIDLRSTSAIRAIVLNVTAGATSLLLLRLATLLVPGSDDAAIPRYIQQLTAPIVWPFRQVPVLNSLVGREVLVADVVLIALVFLTGLLAAGVLTGWRESSRRPPHHPDPYA